MYKKRNTDKLCKAMFVKLKYGNKQPEAGP